GHRSRQFALGDGRQPLQLLRFALQHVRSDRGVCAARPRCREGVPGELANPELVVARQLPPDVRWAGRGLVMAVTVPTLDYEAGLHAQGARYVIGCDEVGRGALAGPVGVGMSVVERSMGEMPDGLRDSKLLSEKRREELAPLSAAWCRFSAVGLASPLEVDQL